MSQRRTNPRILPECGGFDPFGLLGLWTDQNSLTSLSRQWLACFTASLTMVMVGTIYGWTTTTLFPLTTASGAVPLIIGQDEYSWIVSLTVLCSMVGSLVGAQLADRNGRRYSLLVSSAIFTVGWIIIYATTSVRALYLARVIHGIGIGIAQVVNPMYVSEVASINFRGSASTLIAVNVYTGSLLTCMIESWLTYETIPVVLALVSFISFLSNMCFPETPYFLVAKGREEQACKSIAYYKDIVSLAQVKIELLDLLAETKCELDPESTFELQQISRSELPSQARTDLLSQARTDLLSQARTDLLSQARTDLLSQARTDLLSQARTDLLSPSRSSISLSSLIDFALQSGSELPSQSRSDLPSTSKSNLPPQSITEGLSDPIHEADTEPIHQADTEPIHQADTEPIHQADTEPTHQADTKPIHKAGTYLMSDLYLTSSSDSPSTSVIHSEVVCDVHQQPTSELHLQGSHDSSKLPLRPLRALHSQSASELHRPSTSEIQQPSTSEIQQPSTSEIQQPSTSEMRRRSTSEIRRRSTSELHRPHKSEIRRSSASEIQQPSTREIQQPSTRELPLQPSRALQSQSASELHRPSTSEIQRPSTSGIQRPSTSGIQRPSTSGIQRPSTSEKHKPSTSEMNPDLISEMNPDLISEIPTQFHVDLRASTDTDEIYMDGTKRTWLTKLRVILQPSNRRALLIILGLIIARQLSGNYVTIQYLEMLFAKTEIVIDLYEAMILVYLINLVCGAFTITMVDYLGRKVLLYISTLGSCFSLIILAYYLLIVEHKINVTKFEIVPMIDLIAYQIAFQIGLATLPNVFLCDLFPTEQKGFVGAIIVIFDGIIGFIVSKLYQLITNNVGWYAVYFLFSTACCFAFLIVLMHVPETRGKTYHQIKALLATNYY